MPIGVGIEVGQTVLRGVVVERRGTEAHLLRAVEVGLPTVAELPSALGRLKKDLQAPSAAVVGLPTTSCVLATVRPLLVSTRRAALALHFELQQHLPYDAAQAVWHYQWIPTNGRAAAPVSGQPALVTAIKRDVLEERLEAFSRAGWSVKAVSVSALAVANAWLRSHAGSDGVILHASGPLLEVIAVGPTGLEVLPMSLLEVAGGEPQPLLDAVQALWDHFLEQRQATPSAPKISTVWLAGELAGSRGLVPALEQRLGVSVQAIDPAQVVKLPAGQHRPEQLLVAASLALQALGQAPLGVNLLVERRSVKSQDAVRRAAWAIGGVAVAAALWIGGQGMLSTLRQRESVLASLVAQERTYQTLRPELRGLIQQQAHVDRRLRQLRELASRRALLGEAMQRVAEALPDDVWLTKLELRKENRQLGALLEGYARSFQGVTRLMDQLKGTVGWSKVKPLATTVTTDAAGKELIVFAVQSEQPLPSWTGEDGSETEPSSEKKSSDSKGKGRGKSKRAK